MGGSTAPTIAAHAAGRARQRASKLPPPPRGRGAMGAAEGKRNGRKSVCSGACWAGEVPRVCLGIGGGGGPRSLALLFSAAEPCRSGPHAGEAARHKSREAGRRHPNGPTSTLQNSAPPPSSIRSGRLGSAGFPAKNSATAPGAADALARRTTRWAVRARGSARRRGRACTWLGATHDLLALLLLSEMPLADVEAPLIQGEREACAGAPGRDNSGSSCRFERGSNSHTRRPSGRCSSPGRPWRWMTHGRCGQRAANSDDEPQRRTTNDERRTHRGEKSYTALRRRAKRGEKRIEKTCTDNTEGKGRERRKREAVWAGTRGGAPVAPPSCTHASVDGGRSVPL